MNCVIFRTVRLKVLESAALDESVRIARLRIDVNAGHFKTNTGIAFTGPTSAAKQIEKLGHDLVRI